MMAPKKKPEVKNATIRSRVFSRKTDAKGNVITKSTRGYKIKAHAGDKTITNKKGEKVVVRKSGNRVVTKKDGTVVRKKANGDKVITTSRMKYKPRATGPYVEPRSTGSYPWITAGEHPKYPPVSNYNKKKNQ